MTGGQSRSWTDTKLWSALKSRPDEYVQKLTYVLEGVLPKVEDVLNKADTMPGNFTLHDAEHSWRVAERMAEIAGDGLMEEIPPHDLGLLLASAYLHDIGMTPPLGKVKNHYLFLVSGEQGDEITDEAADEFQAWLDDEWNGLMPPIASEAPSADDLRLADEVISGYVRHRHNDWSEEWIREHVAPRAKDLYPGWTDDLIRLCRSHHYGIAELRRDDFDPRLVGSPASVLHLRYCACLLRVADVLDFDPERTPPILFQHRDVSEKSAIFWRQGLALSFVIDGNHLLLSARPQDALVHHAIELTIADVERELQVCRQLDDETGFERMPNRKTPLPHEWRLDSTVKKDVKPNRDAYEYIDGTFRPDPQKVLSLVGGLELYGSHFAAVREVLQNAFDAVREQVARQRLLREDQLKASNADAFATMHKVSLSLVKIEDDVHLICKDTGAGMSREVICSRFLVGGTTPNHDIRALERECVSRGFTVGRTARFGIGVLSYFLLGSKLLLRTRRSVEAHDLDGTGWIFTSGGLADFGELRKEAHAPVGAEIDLLIKPELLEEGADEFAAELRAYIYETVRCVPCDFSFEAVGFDVEPWAVSRGWADRDDDMREMMLEPLADRERSGSGVGIELMSFQRQQDFKQEEQRLRDLRTAATETLSVTIETGELPDGLGSYRISTGHFGLCCGPCLAFLDMQPLGEDRFTTSEIRYADAAAPVGQIEVSWNGMSVDLEAMHDHLRNPWMQTVRNAFVEINLTSDEAGQIAVHRNTLTAGEPVFEAVEWVRQLAKDRLAKIVEEHSDSPLNLLNSALIQRRPDGPSQLWLRNSDTSELERVLAPLEFPAIDEPKYDHRADRWQWRGEAVIATPTLRTEGSQFGRAEFSWHGNHLPPTAVAATSLNGAFQPVLVWEDIETSQGASGEPFPVAEFPPAWSNLVGVAASGGYLEGLTIVWNREHPLQQAVDDTSREWAKETFSKSLDPLPVRNEVMKSGSRVAAWMLRCLGGGGKDIWNGLGDRAADFLPGAWKLVEGLSAHEEILYWRAEGADRSLRVLSPDGWVEHSRFVAVEKLAEMLPNPSDDWWLIGSNNGTAVAEPVEIDD